MYGSTLLLLISVLFKTGGTTNFKADHHGSRSLFVRPSATEDCREKQPCYSLADYVEDSGEWFTSGTTFLFLPGNHTVNRHTSLAIQGIKNLAMTGINASIGDHGVQIQCKGKLEFQFQSIHNLSITNLEFIECGLETFGSRDGMQAAIRCAKIDSLVLRNVNVRESYGYGMVGANILGVSTIVDCVFSNNGWRVTGSRSPMGGNALFLFADSYSGAGLAHSFSVTRCKFINGTATKNWRPFTGALELGGGSGLGLFIYHNSFNSYNLSITVSESSFHDNRGQIGAHILLVSDLVSEETYSYLHTITIKNSFFFNGKATSEGGAVHIRSFQGDQKVASLSIVLMNSTFQHNSARGSGGAMFIKAERTKHKKYDGTVSIRIENSQFKQNKAKDGTGGGIYAQLTALFSYSSQAHINDADTILFNITKCTFVENKATSRGGSVSLFLDPGDIKGPDDPYYLAIKYNLLTTVNISSCHFKKNTADEGSAIIINGHKKEIQSFVSASFICYRSNTVYHIIIQDTIFLNNTWKGNATYTSAVLHLHNVQEIKLIDCQFVDNKGSAIYANASYIYLQGSLNFTRNVAHSGGAFHLECNSFGQSIVYLSTMHISNNQATHYGGAIAVEEQCNKYEKCFFQMPPIENQTDLVFMDNNIAEIAGDSVYGGSLESCTISDDTRSLKDSLKLDHKLFNHIFHLNSLHSESVISSSPYLVCLCTLGSSANKCETAQHVEVFPGEDIILLAAAIGQYEGASPAIIRSTVITPKSEPWELGPRQKIQALGRKCGQLSYLILTPARSAEVHLHVESSQGSQQAPTVVSITFKDCPIGFELSQAPPHVCTCAPHLAVPEVWCNINTQIFQYQGNMWIGNYSDDVTVHRNCPFDYCKPDSSDISLWNQDEQCAHNRSGVLCGGCAQGLSAVLGTTQCLQCSDYYLFLIFPFALAGVLLVFVMFCCNLTVSTGTISGAILYANIVWSNHSIFFPQGQTTFIIYFLRIFIAWLSLDLGIETCFYSGMDTCTKTWLQFLFPLYICILAGGIVYLHGRSSIVSKFFSSNTFPILSTLLLMSYSKLINASFDSMSSVSVTTKTGTSSLLWLLDGNVAYFKGRHIPLFGMGLVVTVVFGILFTLLLLLAPCLQANSNRKWLRWVLRCKPFLDSYQAPYKDNFRFWTGLTLLLRLALFIVFSANSLGDPRLNLFAIILVTSVIPIILYCYNTGGVYKKHFLHLVDAFLLLNLGIFAAASLFVMTSEAAPSKQAHVTTVMVGTAFIVFISTLAFHCYQEAKKFTLGHWLLKCLCPWKQQTSQSIELINEQQTNSTTHQPNVTYAIVEL